MSTILDALRKVESERESPRDQMLYAPAPPTEIRRARGIPATAIIVSAVVAFAGGGILSWWFSEAPSVEVATLPAAPLPPAIPVPRPPVRAPKAQPAAPVAEPAAPADAARAPAAAVAPAPQVAAANPPAESVPPSPPAAARPNEPAVVPAPPAAAAPVQAMPPVVPPVASAPAGAKGEVTGRRAPDKALAAREKQVSALEPSPFAGARGTQTAPGTLAPAEPGKRIAALPKPAAPAAPPAEEKLAALKPPAPPEPAAPALDSAPPAVPEAEPEAPAESLFDTGRSPPGAPKVALSFLQWSADPAKRFAFISIDGAPSQRVHEGEVAGGMTVAAITPTGVQFKREGQTFVIRPRH